MSDKHPGQVWPTFKRLWPYVRPYKGAFVLAILAMAVYGGVDAAMIYLVKPLIDTGLAEGNASALRWAPVLIVGLFIIRGLGNFVSTYCMAWVSQHVIRAMRQSVFEKYLRLPVSYFDTRSSGDLISKVTYDTEQVSRASSSALVSMVRDGFTVLALLFIMFNESWQLSAIFFLVGPVIAWVIALVSRRFRKVSRNIQAAMGGVTSAAEQTLKGHKNVLAFGGQQLEAARFAEVNNRTRQQNMKLAAAQAISQPSIQILGSFALATVLFVASFESVLQNLTPGSFVVIIGSMMGLMSPVKSLTRVNAEFQRGIAAATSVFDVLDEAEAEDKGTEVIEHARGDLALEQVVFSYPNTLAPVIKGIDLTIPAGKTVALVGRSGSGKTTLSTLLPRFYELDSGTIRLDGKDITQLTLSSLRAQIATVSQQVVLFNDTIANNIAYACRDRVSREQIEAAAKAAHVMEFASRLPDGLETLVGEDGVMLSGGQRQRIAIARAILRDAPVLILDEATSALDTESERVIQDALETLQRGRTSLVIAHRLSTIESADEIVVMDQGRIVERGSHQALLAKNGAYRQLHQMQFGES
ncbi:lipid A export permease/ATP-binding protein MsbA [Ferrimonas gelatinilytica]|uniref:Lipid A ABC transporter ATP-binding protein/permease MsbA n=1 Tax=Ferrimonas gelatinilytica TaxID=1255257 RepID=A0ABP9RZJ4_9GAMM